MKGKGRFLLNDRTEIMEKLLEQPVYVVDYLPKQVPATAGGRFFVIEDYERRGRNRKKLWRRFFRVSPVSALTN